MLQGSVTRVRETPVQQKEQVVDEVMEVLEDEDWVAAARKDFPIIGDLVNLDNAATSWSPRQVIGAMVEFEEHYRAMSGEVSIV